MKHNIFQTPLQLSAQNIINPFCIFKDAGHYFLHFIGNNATM